MIGLAHARAPLSFNVLGVPQRYNNLLAVATSARLILFQSDASGMFGARPACEAGASHVWLYDEIARAQRGQVEGLNIHSGGQAYWLSLVPHPQCGPTPGKAARYDFYPLAEGLDDQRRFVSALLPWLEQQINAGAFPMAPAKRAQIEQRVAMEKAAEKVRIREAAERGAALNAAVIRTLPKLVPFAILAASFTAGVYSYLERRSGDPRIFGEEFNVGLLATSALLLMVAIAAFVVRGRRVATA